MLDQLLNALREHERAAGQIYSISTADIELFLRKHPDLTARLNGLDPEVLAFAIQDAIGEIGILEMVENAIRGTILSASSETAYERDTVVSG